MYIRTKNRIYEVDERTKWAQYSIRGKTMVKNADFQYASNENIISQSENLEELCDMTIVVDDERPNSVFELEWGIDNELLSKYKDVEGVYVYGAIYTDKGLIYVAKMDSEGKLVLI